MEVDACIQTNISVFGTPWDWSTYDPTTPSLASSHRGGVPLPPLVEAGAIPARIQPANSGNPRRGLGASRPAHPRYDPHGRARPRGLPSGPPNVSFQAVYGRENR